MNTTATKEQIVIKGITYNVISREPPEANTKKACPWIVEILCLERPKARRRASLAYRFDNGEVRIAVTC